MRTLFFCLVSSLCIVGIVPAVNADDDMQVLKDAPGVLASTYKTDRMVRTVNHLRSLGKDKALIVLKNYINQSDTAEQAKVLLICRLLFVNSQGWKPPQLGEPLPAVNQSITEQFSYFPIALSDGVPFLVVNGYRLGGRAESADACVGLCERFAIIAADLPQTNFATAAQNLIKSESFRQLYKNSGDEKEMAEIVRHQAEAETKKPSEK